MATPSEKLAASLEALKIIQEAGITAIKSAQLSRVHRERLQKNGFIKEVVKGWYIATAPGEQQGDSTSWYASYWQFCAQYLAERYGDAYYLSPEQSIQIHAGSWTIPRQLIVRTAKGTNHLTPLPYNTSLWNWGVSLPKNAAIVTVEGIRIITLQSALVYCTPTMFKSNEIDIRTCLAMISDSSEILPLLLDGGHTSIAGRLAGAFRNIGRPKIADDIVKAMQAADYNVRETDPFETKPAIALLAKERSPYVNRIKLMWYAMREVVIKNFPQAPGLPANHEKYMKQVEDLYISDAYNSLSIERYQVTPALIERVRTGAWDSQENAEDKKQKDAMAARGYWQATQKVRESIIKILNGANAGTIADADHGDWYRDLFAPSVTAGILPASDLAGYRNHAVYISNSMHVPLNKDALRDAMPVLMELIQNETDAAVRAVLGHFMFVFIHPYMDGNGRMGRFLMNVMLASGGYPWTVIPVEERTTYMEALERASVHADIESFVKFLAYLVGEGLEGRPVAGVGN
jgi:Fic/DOC family